MKYDIAYSLNGQVNLEFDGEWDDDKVEALIQEKISNGEIKLKDLFLEIFDVAEEDDE